MMKIHKNVTHHVSAQFVLFRILFHDSILIHYCDNLEVELLKVDDMWIEEWYDKVCTLYNFAREDPNLSDSIVEFKHMPSRNLRWKYYRLRKKNTSFFSIIYQLG